MKTSDILRDARDRILEPSAWCEGAWASTRDEDGNAQYDYGSSNIAPPGVTMAPEPVMWCSEGSLIRSIAQALGLSTEPIVPTQGFFGGRLPFQVARGSDQYRDCMRYLETAIVEYLDTYQDGSEAFSVTGFNDTHDHDQVMWVWDLAIKTADEKGE